MSQPPIAPAMALVQLASGHWISQSIYVVAKLGIADLLKDGAKSCEEMAIATKTHSRSLYRVLRALASLGLFMETEPQSFTITPLGHYLRSDIDNSMRDMVITLNEEHYRAWGELLYSVQTGEVAFDKIYGQNVWEFFHHNPESGKVFDRAMTNFSSVEIPAIVSAYDFSNYQTIVDVAGGRGTLLTTILEGYPHLKGILFDQGSVIEGVEETLAKSPAGDRLQLVKGDFFTAVPPNGDLYLLKHIIHDWGEEQSSLILQRCREGINSGGKVLILEQVIPPGNDPFIGKLLDLNMLVMCPGGCERTREEYELLLGKSGFKLERIIPTTEAISIIEATAS
jgi:hypothetical protein